MQTLKTIAKVFILLVVVTLGTTLHTAQAQAPKLTPAQIYDFKMDQWLDELAMAESNNNPKLDELDVNGKYSRGCLQYQDWTWKHYTQKYGIQGSQFDCNAEREVAKDMIADDYNLWRSWYNSVVHKIGKPPIYS